MQQNRDIINHYNYDKDNYVYVHTKVWDIMDFNQNITTTKLTTAVGWIKGFTIFAMSIAIYVRTYL